MKLISWNVNGLRACIKKGFFDFLAAEAPDFLSIQETKMQEEQVDFETPGYFGIWHSAEKKGYSGTAVFAKNEPVSIKRDFAAEHPNEGRVITLEYDGFFLVNVYSPNSQNELKRLDYRLSWEKDFLSHLKSLDEIKPVIVCGDLNVAHEEIDLKNPKTNRQNAGFSDEERAAFSNLLENGFTDSFRHLYPDLTGAYSWWSYRYNARANNAGWRIDYFLVSNRIADKIKAAKIYSDVLGSDHCPVGLEIEI